MTSGNGSGNKSLLAGKHANEKHAEVKRQNQTQEDIEGMTEVLRKKRCKKHTERQRDRETMFHLTHFNTHLTPEMSLQDITITYPDFCYWGKKKRGIVAHESVDSRGFQAKWNSWVVTGMSVVSSGQWRPETACMRVCDTFFSLCHLHFSVNRGGVTEFLFTLLHL